MGLKLAIFTEIEACGRWCPISLASQPDSPSVCHGSRCMAWRWTRTHIHDPAGGPDLVPSGDNYGYCGMAGPPATDRGE